MKSGSQRNGTKHDGGGGSQDALQKHSTVSVALGRGGKQALAGSMDVCLDGASVVSDL